MPSHVTTALKIKEKHRIHFPIFSFVNMIFVDNVEEN